MSFIKSFKGYKNFLKSKNKNKNKKSVYIYSESSSYRNHFEDIIINLSNLNKYDVCYFTSNLLDNKSFTPDIKPIYIGSGIIRMIFFTFLKCDIMLMTLTDLDNHEIKKSKNCKNYLYLFHSLCSTFKSYTKNAFDNYDIILANGSHQVEEIRKNEKLFNLKKKEIFNIGYPYLENLKRKIHIENKNDTVLFAPSWSNNTNDLLENYGIEIIEILLKNFKVFFRPHPQSFIKSKKIIEKIKQKFQNNKNFTLNKDTTDLKSFDESGILLTDNGGICIEYYTLYERPFICIDYKEKIHNADYHLIADTSIEEEFKNTFSVKLNISSLKYLESNIKTILNNFKFDRNKLENFFKSYSIEFNGSAKKASDKIEEILTQN